MMNDAAGVPGKLNCPSGPVVTVRGGVSPSFTRSVTFAAGTNDSP